MMNLSESSRIHGAGYGCVLMAAVLWASSGALSKFLFNSGISPFQLVQLRTTLSAAVLLGWFLIQMPQYLKISRKDILYFAVLGSVVMASMQFFYLFAISKIHVAAAILLQYLAPIFIAVYSATLLREKPAPATVIAVSGTTLGCYLVVGAYNLDILNMNFQGIVSGILSAVAFAGYSVLSEYGLRRYHPVTVLFYALFFASLTWNMFHPPLEGFMHAYSAGTWIRILCIALPGTLLPFGLYVKGLGIIGSARASITATFEPITAAIISYVFLNEAMSLVQIAGAVMVIAAIVLLQLTHAAEGEPAAASGTNRSRPVRSGARQ